MKYLKQKLIAATSMVMVAFVMLTSASYAWFTISTAPEVQEISATATANENFEIALGTKDDLKETPDKYAEAKGNAYYVNNTGDNHYWGAMVKFANSANPLVGLGPATLDGGALKSTEYGEDGRPAGLQAITQKTGETMSEGTIALYDVDGNKVGQKILLWVRTNVAATGTGEATGVTADISGVTFGGEAGNKVEIAFQVENGTIYEANIASGEATNVKVGNLAANTATRVYMYVYLEGANVKNEDVATAVNVAIDNITFKHAAFADGATAYNNAGTVATGGN